MSSTSACYPDVGESIVVNHRNDYTEASLVFILSGLVVLKLDYPI